MMMSNPQSPQISLQRDARWVSGKSVVYASEASFLNEVEQIFINTGSVRVFSAALYLLDTFVSKKKQRKKSNSGGSFHL